MIEPSRSQVTRVGARRVSCWSSWLRSELTYSMIISRGNHCYPFAGAVLGGAGSGIPAGGRASIGVVARAVNRVRG